MRQLKQRLANTVVNFFRRPSLRYHFFLPLVEALDKNPDEEILLKAFKFIEYNDVAGDYLEFGVWKGRSFIKAYHIKKYLKIKKQIKFYAFDSFEGLPEIKSNIDRGGGFKGGDYKCDLETFKKILIKNGIDINEVTIAPGWYEQVLNEKTKRDLDIKSAAIIFIDCDLYESAVSVLNFVTDYVVDGTIIIFDDWYNFKGDPDKGEQKAFREWLNKNSDITATEWQKVNWKTNSFIIHKTKTNGFR